MSNTIVGASVFTFNTILRSPVLIFLILSISIAFQTPDHMNGGTTDVSIMAYAFSSSNTIQRKGKHITSISSPKGRLASKRVINPTKRKTYSLQSTSKTDTAKNLRQSTIENAPTRPLVPPFPDGLNNGRIVILPPSEHYLLDSKLSGNPLLLPPRDISVWLPPDYDLHPNMNFPVLYCHDGQNAIQDSSSWTGSSWRLAGALTRLSERKLLTRTTETNSPPIVVLIPSSEEKVLFVPRRHLEYGDSTQTFARAHADFVALTLKPLIDAKFRTVRGKEGNAVMGTSLGGQASLHLCLRHPDVFGAAVCMSPAFSAGVLASVATLPEAAFEGKMIYLDNGGDDDEVKVPLVDVWDHVTTEHWWNPGYWWLDSQLQVAVDAMKFALDARNVKYEYKKISGGRHNERAWACRIHKPMLFLYGDGDEH